MVDIIERLNILFPGIKIGLQIDRAECEITGHKIVYWGRQELQPTEQELNDVPEEDITSYLESLSLAAQAILNKQEIADLKQSSPDSLELLGKDDLWISDNIEILTAGSTNPEIVAGIREALKQNSRINRDILNVLKAMVK